jgi:acetoin utilization protein AcuB
MIVDEVMIKNVISLQADNTIEEAINLMKTKKIRHLPIVDGDNHLIGLVNASRLREASPSVFHVGEHLEDLQKPLSSIMRTDIIYGHPLDFVEEIAGLFYEHRISCLPITKDNKLVGIVTETDLLRTMVELTGAHQPGSQIEIRVPNITGQICGITALFHKRKANILSILVYPDKKDDHFKILVFRVQMINPVGLIEELKNAGLQVLWPNLPGISK